MQVLRIVGGNGLARFDKAIVIYRLNSWRLIAKLLMGRSACSGSKSLLGVIVGDVLVQGLPHRLSPPATHSAIILMVGSGSPLSIFMDLAGQGKQQVATRAKARARAERQEDSVRPIAAAEMGVFGMGLLQGQSGDTKWIIISKIGQTP
jgi:hypothetical protein